MANPLLIQILSSFHLIRDTRRIVKDLLKEKKIANGYEMYLRKETIIRSYKTIEDYVNPRSSSEVFNTFKHLEVFVEKHLEDLETIHPGYPSAFMACREQLVELKALTAQFFENEVIANAYTEFLLREGITKSVAKKWASPEAAWSTWFDSMEHFYKFAGKENGLINSVV